MDPILHDPEALLAHDGFVRALARSLIGDAYAADDVAQDAWVATLERPPRAGSSPRAWLTGVVRNLVLERRRGEGRLAAREQAAARPERVPSDAEILEREEARRAVVASVLALDEPYRTVLLLRYFEDSPPREIARRVGVPFETVRTRLKRALDLVRADLDRRRGDRRAWCLALLPFSRLAPRAGPFASLRLEITQMSMPLQFSIGTLVLGSLVAGVAGWLSRGDAPPVAAPARPAVAARPAAPPVVFVRGGIEVQPADGLNFGTVPKGTRAAKEIAVRNGNPKAAMKIAAARLVDPKSVRSGEPGEPAANADHFRVQVIEDEPGKAARIVVIVKGTMPAGEFSATLSLETGVPDGPARLLIPIQGSVK